MRYVETGTRDTSAGSKGQKESGGSFDPRRSPNCSSLQKPATGNFLHSGCWHAFQAQS